MFDFLSAYIDENVLKVMNQFLPPILILIICLIVIQIIMKMVRKMIKKSKLRGGLHTFVEKTIKVILYCIMI